MPESKKDSLARLWAGQPVPYPAPAQREAAIQAIVREGLPQPQRLSTALWELWRAVGVRGLFFGVEDCLFLGLLADVAAWLTLLLPWTAWRPGPADALLFFAAPFFYLLLHLLTLWKEMYTGVYEWKMLCRCSLRQLTALRMLAFGGTALGFSTGLGAVLRWGLGVQLSLFRLFSVSASALFLFALLDLWAQQRGKNPAASLLAPTAWAALGGLLALLHRRAGPLLAALPTALFALLALGLALAYVRALKQYYFTPKEGALGYAVG